MSHPLRQTALHEVHIESGGCMREQDGWALPAHYGTPLEEHRAVRSAAGMFDLSHLLALDVCGAGATAWLRHLLANDVAQLGTPGSAMHSCMLDEHGGVLDEFVVFRISSHEYRIIVHAARVERVVEWMRSRIASTGANLTLGTRKDLAMIGIEGPETLSRAMRAIPELNTATGIPSPFAAVRLSDLFIARAGFTGEEALAIALPDGRTEGVWRALLDAGVRPCGHEVRDTLRIEAGLPLYGQDIDASLTPFDVGLRRSANLDDPERHFIGRTALEMRPPRWRLMGLVADAESALRPGLRVRTPYGEGTTTSCTFSPAMKCQIALVRLPRTAVPDETAIVETSPGRVMARVVGLPFVRSGTTVA
jgi:aminomethyltransferase